MYHNRKLWSLFIVLLLLSGCSSTENDDGTTKIGSGGGSSHNAKWTYLVYVAGDNNLATSAAIDINEMEMVGSSDDVNIIVQVEYSSTYTPSMPTSTLRGKITKDSDTETITSQLESIGNRDMGSKEALTEFINWGVSNYPAEHTALVLWDHGSGWKSARNSPKRGALQDATSGTFMSLPDLASALRESGKEIDLLDFDACLMAMYEVAYEFKGLVKYMSFSEEVEPGDGDPYDTILQSLRSNPQMSPRELAVQTAQKYKNFYSHSDRSSVTKSSIDMEQIAQLHTELRELVQLLVANINTERSYIQTARGAATSYEYDGNIDLGDFLNRLYALTSNTEIKNKIDAIKNTLGVMVVSNKVYSPQADNKILQSTGLSIFLPQRSEVSDDDLRDYADLAINTAVSSPGLPWKDVINVLVTGDSGSGQTQLETTTGNFAIWLEWDTDADLDLIVWEPDGEFAAPYIGMTSSNGFLSEDSATSGIPVEYYSAAEVIQKGRYDILVNCYSEGTAGPSLARLKFIDPAHGINDWIVLDERYMDLSVPAPADWYDDAQAMDEVWNDSYSDWWWWYSPTYLERSSSFRGLSLTSPYKEQGIEFRVHVNYIPQKSSQKEGIETAPQNINAMRETLVQQLQNMDKAQ